MSSISELNKEREQLMQIREEANIALKILNTKLHEVEKKLSILECKSMKVFIKYKSSWIFRSLEKITFDTLGAFSHLREARLQSEWKVKSSSDSGEVFSKDKKYTLRYYNNVPSRETIADMKMEELLCRVSDGKGVVMSIYEVNNTILGVKFNSVIFDWESAMDITHQILMYCYNI